MSKTKQKSRKQAPAHPQPQAAPVKKSLSRRTVFWLSVTGLLVLTAIYYWPLLTAKGFLWNDFVEQNFPYRLFASKFLKTGIFPFWNPYVFSGMPFFADIQTAVLYPLNLVLTLFSSDQWLSPALFQIQIVFHIFIAGLGMFLLGKEFRLGTAGSLLSAITFMFSAFLTTHIFHSNVIHAASWFPLIILFFNRMIYRKSLLYMTLTAVVLSMCMFAGHPQIMVHMYYWLGAYFVFLLVYRLKNKSANLKTESVKAALFAGAVALSVGLSSIQLLPTAELAQESARPSITLEESTIGSLRPYRLVTIVAPNFFGTPNQTYWGISSKDNSPGIHNYWETAVYAGILPLVLSIIALVFVRNPQVIFLGATGLLALLLSMGDSGLIYSVAFKVVPALDRFRVPARFGYIFIISVALLAGYGLQFLMSKKEKLQSSTAKKVFIVSGAAGTIAFLGTLLFSSGAFNQQIASFMAAGMGGSPAGALQYVEAKITPEASKSLWIFFTFLAISLALLLLNIKGKLSGKSLALCALTLTFIDLAVFGAGYASVGEKDPARVFAMNDLVKQLQEQGKHEYFRINSRSTVPGTYDIGGGHMFLYRNQGSVHDLFLTEGYNQLRLKRQLVNSRDRTFDILNVKYKIKVDEKTNQMGIVEHQSRLPRVWMASKYQVETREDAIQSLLYSEGFDHRKSVILETEPDLTGVTLDSTDKWSARITSYSLNKIDIDVQSGKGGLLVLSEIYYPAWKAYIDGKPAPVYRADYALRAVPVSGRSHKVVFKFQSSSFSKGLILTLVSIAAAIGLVVFSLFRFRRETASRNV